MSRRLSSFRSGLQTFALTTTADAYHQLSLIWGVTPFYNQALHMSLSDQRIGESTALDLMNGEPDATSEMLKVGERTLLDAKVVDAGETLVMMAGRLSGLGLSSSVVVWS